MMSLDEDQGVEVKEDPPVNNRESILPQHGDGPTLERYHDHFTLHTQSTIVRFRSRTNSARVYENKGSQLVLEESVNPETKVSEVTVKHQVDGTSGLQFLRATYTVVTALLCGFLFVFFLNLILFLVLDLAIVSGKATGKTEQDINYGLTIGVVLAIYVFVLGFSQAMVIAGHFVYDTWSGHLLVKRFVLTSISDVIVDWVFFVFFICIPVLVGSLFLIIGSDYWWEYTALSWFCCIFVFFAIFCVNIIYVEVRNAYNFVKNRDDTDKDDFFDVIKRCILLRQIQTYSGKRRATYLSRSTFRNIEDTDTFNKSDIFESTRREWYDPYSWLTQQPFLSQFFSIKDPPTMLFTIEDVEDYRPFLTKYTWSLERVFCRPANSRYITVVKGPGALRRAQLRSSVMCSFLGTFLILLVFTSILIWFGIPGAYITFIFVLAALWAAVSLDSAYRLGKVAQDLLDLNFDFPLVKKTNADNANNADRGVEPQEEEGESMTIEERELAEKASQALYLVTQYERITEATEQFCWIMFGVEVCLCFLFPLISLYTLGNSAVGTVFFLSSSVSGARHYLNAGVAVEETGNMDLIKGETDELSWQNQSRFSEILDAVTASKSQKLWFRLLGFCGFAFVALFLGAVGESSEGTFTDETTYLPDFEYLPKDQDMRYPTCTLGNIQGGFGPTSTMADFAFLAGTAYRPENYTQIELDKWFLDTVAIDDISTVQKFREDEGEADTSVHFKLIRFPEQELGMILIRGTQTKWDMLADTQLWSAAALMQGLRSLLPFGGMWTPILDQLVLLINGLESESTEKVSFYKTTTKFAKSIKNNFTSVQVTGHSLGGGLSLITGAQAKIPAVGLSAPNALISGRSFDEPIYKKDLNRYTFNIIPNRDIVPMLDDHADQFQYIRCEADLPDFIGCHGPVRALCEILYTCGSLNRPPPCDCHTTYGYPKPEAKDGANRTFEEACPRPWAIEE